MYWQRKQKIQTLRFIANAAALLLLVVFIAAHLYFYLSKALTIESIWWSEEQRAAQKWQGKDYLSAAKLLASTNATKTSLVDATKIDVTKVDATKLSSSDTGSLPALAFYAAEDFSRASKLFAQQHHFVGYFSLANSLAHQERYEDAIIAYRMALALDPESPAAMHNRQLAEILKTKPRQLRDKDQDSKGDFSADEISFDLDKQNSDKAVDDALASGDLGEGALRQLWLRQLNRKPVDFLQRKFAYQLQQKNLAQAVKKSADGIVDGSVEEAP